MEKLGIVYRYTGYIQFIMRSVLNIINWIYPIKTHGERLGASLGPAQKDHCIIIAEG
jgi:hypothetical protein